MIESSRLKMIRRRLTAAVERHGLWTVITVILASVMQNGVTATLRVGGAERPFPWKKRGRKVARQAEAAVNARRSRDADLDGRYSLPTQAWAQWLPVLAPVEHDASAQLAFVVQGENASDLARTHAAIEALGSQARLWRNDEAHADGAIFRVFIKAGDEPSAAMPAAIARAAQGGICEIVSFDFWRDSDGAIEPILLPGANPTLLRAANYLFSRLALRGDALAGAGPLINADARDLALRWLKGRPITEVRGRWRHAAQPLLRAEISSDALVDERLAVLARPQRLSARAPDLPITAVICTKDKGHLTRQLVHRLLSETPARIGEIVVVSNNTTNPYALATLRDIRQSDRVKVLRVDEPFNFSKLCNAGALHGIGRGPLLFLNDDITPVSEDWLSPLIERFDDSEVGSVGPLLLYPDERVQHAGMYLGFRGAAGHTLRGARLPEDDYLLTGCAPREVSAVTGAVLLTRRSLFEALGGFDEQLPTFLQDVDYCLRLRRSGFANVFEPASILIHMESTSIRQLDVGDELQRMRQAERARFLERWGETAARDPLHPAGFELEDETLHRLSGPNGARPKGGSLGARQKGDRQR